MATWRSELVNYGTLVLPTDDSKRIIGELGRECLIEFVDMNEQSLARPYRQYLQRLDETERQLKFLLDTIDHLPGAQCEIRKVDAFLNYTANFYSMNEVEHQVNILYDEFVEFTNNNNQIEKSIAHAYEYRELCQVSKKLLTRDTAGSAANLEALQRQSSIAQFGNYVPGQMISTLAGVVPIENADRLRRAVLYATRGNCFTHIETLEMSEYKARYAQDNSKKAEKKAEKESKKKSKKIKKLGYDPNALQGFCFIFPGDKGSVTYEKISRAISGAEARKYTWPASQSAAETKIRELNDVIATETQALDHYSVLLLHEIEELLRLTHPSGNALIGDWALHVEMEKVTYAALDFFEQNADSMRCDVWYPRFEEDHILKVLAKANSPTGGQAFLMTDNIIPSKNAVTPTYFRNTGFTRGFQNFVNTYGIPRYREINPALVTSVTLPYLFGIMYGDIGHGIFVMAFGLALILMYQELKISKNEMVQMMLGGRYMIFLMGIFAIYGGFLYNDFLSIGMDLFGTRYYAAEVSKTTRTWKPSSLHPSFPYPFGFDPVWKEAENELTFLNSFKMKYSIVVAGFHMGLGVILKGANAALLSDWISFTCEFLPQFVFFGMFVLYLDFMIIYKWINPGTAPNLINSIIEFGMLKAPEQELYPGQALTQKVMAIIMLISVPWMLIPKPLLENMKHKKMAKQKANDLKNLQKVNLTKDIENGENDEDMEIINKDDEEEYSFGEEMIHQLIETIEFVLGAISNTASYLRLWALSLAHQQLAIVFFEMTIAMGIHAHMGTAAQTALCVLLFGAFAACTFVVMLCMDALECYLHALRLQWVEFQSKFYKADGRLFRAFNYHNILNHVDED